ncbi:tRNA (adenosine(37)-N6)-dimethylallyltransferase MiaA [Moraxella nasovis]|uniref:tRNA (adenosine(37)-N6)-dimethylallyltransferase MiaA n=1 Tax=Moraxella nasovis TaxID=2904121 RepID=UPI001F625C10|nr:tRNA (adenosine(37)-N6)-dimethylallyltransferase MiaA [Moraxella nasovis]UNU73136.1 tRNA (adenosine(37)-N6)-dimethylallyltransferase MiaA [Moraxella nasovis]
MPSLNHKNLPDNTVLSLIAPTASGKTDLACKLYDTGRFELISVDSALIYRDMNIGTAKPTDAELAQFPHHLVDIIDPTEVYNVANFVTDVKSLIEQIHNKGKIPLLVGGTMMYYMALFDGLSAVPDTDPKIRQKVANWLYNQGIDELYAYLQKHDPKICNKLKITDTQRITRAVEVHLQTDVAMSVWQTTPKQALCHDTSKQWIGLSVCPDRAWLHDRIALRLDMMWQAGFIDEVIGLIRQYPTLTPTMPSMRCVGYRQVLEFLAVIGHDAMMINDQMARLSSDLQKNNKILENLPKNHPKSNQNFVDLACQDMKNKALYATRQLAKRQSTWQRQLQRLNFNNTNVKITSFDSIQQLKNCLF